MWIELLLGVAMAWQGNGNDWSWEATPITDGFELNPDGFDDAQATEEAFELALDIWNSEGMANVYLPYMGTTDNTTYGGGDDTHNVTKWTARTFTAALAQSRYNSSGDDMIDCDTEFYGTNIYGPKTWSTDLQHGAAPGEYDFVHTAVHELGHCIGFSHSSADDAIMNSTNSSGTGWERRHLTDDDVAGLQAMYGAGEPRLEVVEVRIEDADGDGKASPGETLTVEVEVHNTGAAPSVDVQGVLLVGAGEATLVQDAADMGDLPPGAERGTDADTLLFEAKAGACPGSELVFDVAISDWIGGEADGSGSIAMRCASGPTGTDPTGSAATDTEAPAGCSCAHGPGPGFGWLVLPVLLWRRRAG